MLGRTKARRRSATGLILLAGAILVSMAPLSPARAALPLHSIVGRIEFENGQSPRDRLEVSLRSVLNGATRVTHSDVDGRFLFDLVAPGRYIVSVAVPTSAFYESGSVEIEVIDALLPANFTASVVLRRKEEPASSPVRGRSIDAKESDASIPGAAKKAYGRGVDASAKKRYEEAVKSYREAIAIAPGYLYALNDLGVALTRLRRYDEAIPMLRRAVEVAPNSYPPRLNLAIALLESGMLVEADSVATRAAELDSSAGEAHFVRARIARQMGERERATESYERAYALGGIELVLAEFEAAQVYEEMEQPDDAVRAYAIFLSIVQSGPQAEMARERLRKLGAM
jgi:tetratricopeptide (TPR) repeat protein